MLGTAMYMNKLLLYLLCTVACDYYQVVGKRILQMGVLLPYTGSWPVGLGISGAVPLAVNFVRTDPKFEYFRQYYELNYTIFDCPCDAGAGLVTFSKAMLKHDIQFDIFIGKRSLTLFFNQIKCAKLLHDYFVVTYEMPIHVIDLKKLQL